MADTVVAATFIGNTHEIAPIFASPDDDSTRRPATGAPVYVVRRASFRQSVSQAVQASASFCATSCCGSVCGFLLTYTVGFGGLCVAATAGGGWEKAPVLMFLLLAVAPPAMFLLFLSRMVSHCLCLVFPLPSRLRQCLSLRSSVWPRSRPVPGCADVLHSGPADGPTTDCPHLAAANRPVPGSLQPRPDLCAVFSCRAVSCLRL